jgi:putative two-component system response regulator
MFQKSPSFYGLGPGITQCGFGMVTSGETNHLTTGTILIVDDDRASLLMLEDLLTLSGFRVLTAEEGRQGIEAFVNHSPDLVITDIRMPHVDGLELLRNIRELDALTPVILVTGHGDLENAMRALRRGAYDFILKPINPEVLLNAARKGVDHYRLKRFEQDYRYLLEEQVEERTRELARANEFLRKLQGCSIFALAKLAESRDGETGDHLKRLQAYCVVLCSKMSLQDQYRESMTERFIRDLVQCSVLHDIGKVAIPDSILFNPRKFGTEEFEIMKQHTLYGGKALEEASLEIGGEDGYLTLGKDVAYFHHEHWDGTGYPFGLREGQIPLAARIVAVADVYDALTTERRYKNAFSHKEAVGLIVESRGRQFDPGIVDAFVEVEDEFRRICDCVSQTNGSQRIETVA